MKYKNGSLMVCSPFVVAVISAHLRSVWLVIATVILMFVVVGVLPLTRKRESLWLFVICAFSSIPINLFLLQEYPVWQIMAGDNDSRVFRFILMIEMVLIYTSVEEVIIALIGRKIWKRQYALSLPEAEEE